MIKLYFIAGASGSGKTSIKDNLQTLFGDSMSVYDFDDIGVPKNPDKRWRQSSTEKWLERLLYLNKDACLLGQMVLGEILACPSATMLQKINFCLLDVDDFQRIQRLKKRNSYGVDQNTLNWAAWLRMHNQDPQWMQKVVKDESWEGLNFSVWDRCNSWNKLANVTLLDTSGLSIPKVSELVFQWICEDQNLHSSKS